MQDIFCLECMAYVGWKYISAYDKTQKYKEGKVILERACLVDFDKSSPSPPTSDHTGSRVSVQLVTWEAERASHRGAG
eukprot:1156761-Pelagomonas_calceolata.AAC.2